MNGMFEYQYKCKIEKTHCAHTFLEKRISSITTSKAVRTALG